MASENPDDKKELDPKDGSEKPKKYKGVYKRKNSSKWYGQLCRGEKNISLGTFDTAIAAAIAYDNKAREFNRAEKTLNFPGQIHVTDQSMLPKANPSAGGVQISGPSGSSSGNVGKGKKRQSSESEIDAVCPYSDAKKKEFEASTKEFVKATQNVPQLGTDAHSLPATMSTLPTPTSSVSGIATGSEFTYTSSVQSAVMESEVSARVIVQNSENVASSDLLTAEEEKLFEELCDGKVFEENWEPSDKD